MPFQTLSHTQTGDRAAEVSRISSISEHAHGTPIRCVGPSFTTTAVSYPDNVTQSYPSDGIAAPSPPLGPYLPNSCHSTNLQTQPNHLQLNIPNMPDNPTGYYPEGSGCQFGFSDSHHLVRGPPPSRDGQRGVCRTEPWVLCPPRSDTYLSNGFLGTHGRLQRESANRNFV